MAREQFKGPESAFTRILNSIGRILGNERGEIGTDAGEEGSAGSDWNAEGNLPDNLDPDREPLPIAKREEGKSKPEPTEAIGDEEVDEKRSVAEEGDGAEGEEEGQAEKTSPELQSLQAQMEDLQRQMDLTKQMAEFYQTKYNEVVGKADEELFGQKSKPLTQAKAIPGQEGSAEFEPPPEENWESPQQVVDYFDKRTRTHIDQGLNQRMEEFVTPMFERTTLAIQSLIDRFLKPQMEGFDDVIKDVSNELFILDPTGQTVIGTRNKALLQYFQCQPLPQLAMYDYGISKKSAKDIPAKIKAGTEKATKETLKKVLQKPKGPKDIRSGASSEDTDELDWNTPRDQVEKVLQKRGLI